MTLHRKNRRPITAGSLQEDVRLGSASFDVTRSEITIDIVFFDAIRLADTNRSELTGLDQSVHRHRAHSHHRCNLGHCQELGLRFELRHWSTPLRWRGNLRHMTPGRKVELVTCEKI